MPSGRPTINKATENLLSIYDGKIEIWEMDWEKNPKPDMSVFVTFVVYYFVWSIEMLQIVVSADILGFSNNNSTNTRQIIYLQNRTETIRNPAQICVQVKFTWEMYWNFFFLLSLYFSVSCKNKSIINISTSDKYPEFKLLTSA